MSITVAPRTKSMVRAEYSVSVWANSEKRPRLIIGAHTASAVLFRIERREIMKCRKLASVAQPRQDTGQHKRGRAGHARPLQVLGCADLKHCDGYGRRNRYKRRSAKRRDGRRG